MNRSYEMEERQPELQVNVPETCKPDEICKKCPKELAWQTQEERNERYVVNEQLKKANPKNYFCVAKPEHLSDDSDQ